MNSLVGIGLYSVSEASALTGVSQQNIRRWVFGYSRKNKDGKRIYCDGIWTPDPAKAGVDNTLSFQDLLEVRFINAFRKFGVSLQSIRTAAARAKEMFHSDHPFACKRFQTDGRGIFATVAEESDEDSRLIELVSQQYAFNSIMQPFLESGIEYNDAQQPARWYPLKGNKLVVIDPARSFGRPIIDEYGVPTDVLHHAWKAEGENAVMVAREYEVTKEMVEAAVEFEQGIASGALLH